MYKDTTELKIIYDATKIELPEHYAIMPIDILKLSVRATHVLETHKVYILKDFNNIDYETLFRTKNCGIKTVHEIVESLHKFIISNGLELAKVNDTAILEIENWYNSQLDTPSFSTLIEKYNIKSENDFLLVRETIDDKDIIALDSQRFKYYLNMQPNLELKQLLYIIPNWVLSTNVEFIPFKAKVQNSFKDHKIDIVRDLCSVNISEIKNWRSFGATSLKNIIDTLIEFSFKEQMFPTSYATEDQIEDKITRIPLLDHIENSLRELDDNERNILELRLGYKSQKNTLEEVGEKLGVTRERIRQIEKKAYDKLINYNYWDDVLIDKIGRMLFNRKVPLYVSMLEVEDYWFEGCSEKQDFIAELIYRISEKRFSILNFGEPIISKITQDLFFSLLNELLKDIDNITSEHFTKDDLNLMLEEKLTAYDCNDLNDIFMVELENKLHFRHCEVTNEDYLVGVGSGFKVRLLSLLQEYDTPMHYSEITQKFNQRYNCSCSERAIHSKFGIYPDFKLFGRGIYGIVDHLCLNEGQQNYIIAECEKLIEQNNINKQWSCHELLNLFPDRTFIHSVGLDKYKLDIILQKSLKINSMGRQIWVHTECQECISQSRLEIESTCIQILQTKGSTLPTDSLLEEVKKIRGFGEFLILQPNKSYTRVAPNLWGLVERDFPIANEDKINLLNKLWGVLKDLGFCLLIEEIKEFLEIETCQGYKKLTNYMIYSLANLDERFKPFRGNFIGLAEWSNNKRFTFSSAVSKVVNNMTLPMTTEEIQKQVEPLVMRKVLKHRVSNHLSMNPQVIHDKQSGLWLKV
jgi:RNA polymerase sigma factor (sigma-70 family)